MKVTCGLKTCIHNNGEGTCDNQDLELNYFDDISIFGDTELPDGTKAVSFINNTVGHFMGLQCRDFKMNHQRARRLLDQK
jgi:hypothetical protein